MVSSTSFQCKTDQTLLSPDNRLNGAFNSDCALIDVQHCVYLSTLIRFEFLIGLMRLIGVEHKCHAVILVIFGLVRIVEER